ncbi:dTDP-4-dehydro-6-deoxyglucose reductase [Sporomusa ovata DSM 2662]|uniref:UDP-glucose 4-epimerase n=1 Tax=Sporomusa ovata TaxID=2378 RepID=A0A0U1KSX5_9FIRM|nr:NAD(P)-dependent oxidoreductase [Sporomusa ovata]EQB26446.1 NAD dependent epimerase/dehydratase family protein [Sporomusa ovata DSM 2662]CQR70530.1 UDP-glucose 4-epimerase [Sporomusa ovata]
MNKVIITGANGFIGTELIRQMSERCEKIYAIIKDEQESIDAIRDFENVEIIYCELAQIDRLSSLIKEKAIDCCFHLAWAGSTGDARGDYALQLMNVHYACDVVMALIKMNCKRFVGAGTLAELDVQNYIPTDGATPNLTSEYGTAKLTAHYLTKAICAQNGIEHVWVRLSNTYGVGNRTGNFINFASKLMLEGKPANFTAATQTYDFVYVTDTIRAMIAAAEKGKANCVYYLGSNSERPLKEYICMIRDAIDPSIELHLGAVSFNGICLPPEMFSGKKLHEDTGFVPNVDFADGIKTTVEWLRTQM